MHEEPVWIVFSQAQAGLARINGVFMNADAAAAYCAAYLKEGERVHYWIEQSVLNPHIIKLRDQVVRFRETSVAGA